MDACADRSVLPGLLRFHEAYFERIWGGARLRTLLGRSTPSGQVIGEAWLVSDHPSHESVVSDGPFEGKTLRDIMLQHPGELLGSRAKPTPHGRFPLLLKLLDSREALSVQVHPDDDTARRLGEPDVGKTEMWHVLDADPGSELICGLDPATTPELVASAIQAGSLERHLIRVPAPAGTSVFVPAGTVHAIGGGILLAEIQQNSDITYRLYDWGRVDAAGNPRPLHVDKAMQAIHFGSRHGGAAHPLEYSIAGGQCTVLAACRYFAAELLTFEHGLTRGLSGDSFHMLLAKDGPVCVATFGATRTIDIGEAVVVPATMPSFTATGPGALLDFYVPNLARDIIEPLRTAGHPAAEIGFLGGPPESSDVPVGGSTCM